MIVSSRVSPDPVSVLWHYIRGQMCDWVNGSNGPVCWRGMTHRGVQWLNKVEFPRKQKRYIFSPLFEIRYNTRFEEVIRACADLSREGKTWISEDYIQGMVALNRMGFAHSYEAWNEGKLVGGAFGVQLGSIITCDSMFHRLSNASKAAYGQTLVRLQQRGFRLVDTNGVASHMVNYGEEWMHHWQYQKLALECLRDAPSLTDDRPCPALPWEIRAMLPMLKVARKAAKLLPRRKKPPTPPPAGEASAESAAAPPAPQGGPAEETGQDATRASAPAA